MATCTKVNGKTTRSMDWDPTCFQMVASIAESTLMTKSMARDIKSGLMGAFIRGSTVRARSRAKVSRYGPMVNAMKASGRPFRCTGKAHCDTKMALFTRVASSMTKGKELKVNTPLWMAPYIQVAGRTTSATAKAKLSIQMVHRLRENG